MISPLPTFRVVEERPPEWRRLRDALLELSFRHDFSDLNLPDLLEASDLSEEEFLALYADLEDCYCGI